MGSISFLVVHSPSRLPKADIKVVIKFQLGRNLNLLHVQNVHFRESIFNTDINHSIFNFNLP